MVSESRRLRYWNEPTRGGFRPPISSRCIKQYEALDREGKGALLRREGLYTSRISEWRKQRDQGVLAAFAPKLGRPEADPRDRELARLCRELAHAELELDKARKVVEIQSKLSALF